MKNIKAFWCDIDGVLTDGMYHVGSNGELFKSFYTRDFGGLQSLIANDIKVHLLTHSDDSVIDQKIQSLNGGKGADIEVHNLTSEWINTFKDNKNYPKSLDKGEYLEWWCRENGMKLKEIAYMGDAEGDISAIKISGLSGCPNDAIKKVYKYCNFYSKYNGGKGAVWEFCNEILKHNKKVSEH